MSFLMPQDDNGWTAFDYGRAILHELQNLNAQEEGEGELATPRFMSAQADPWNGAATSQDASFRVPPGARWKLLNIAVGSGLAGTDLTSVLVYRNSVAPSNLLDVIPATVGGNQAKGAPAPVPLEENTVLIVRFLAAAAPASGAAFVNIAVEQTMHGKPQQVQDDTLERLAA